MQLLETRSCYGGRARSSTSAMSIVLSGNNRGHSFRQLLCTPLLQYVRHTHCVFPVLLNFSGCILYGWTEAGRPGLRTFHDDRFRKCYSVDFAHDGAPSVTLEQPVRHLCKWLKTVSQDALTRFRRITQAVITRPRAFNYLLLLWWLIRLR